MEKNRPLKNIEALIIGGSAGSLEVILAVLPELDEDLPFPIIVVLHRKSGADHLLVDLFSGRTKIPVLEIDEKQKIEAGKVYIAPSDYHMLVEKDKTFSLDFSEKVNYSRPSIDVAFQSAADVYRDRLAALLLSGANADGTRGLKFVSHFGGLALIQDPDTATVAYMPAQASAQVKISTLLKTSEIAEYINSLAGKENKK